MKKLLHFLSICVLTSLFVFSPFTYASMDAMEAQEEEAIEGEEATASAEDSLVLSIQHTVNADKPLPPKTVMLPWSDVNDNPLVIVQSLIDEVMEQLPFGSTTPIKVRTEVSVKLEDDVAKVLGDIPKLTINTQQDAKQNIISDIAYPAYHREVPKEFEAGTIDWKGMTGQIAYTQASQSINIVMNTDGLAIEKKEDFKFNFGKLALNLGLDANTLPTKVDFTFAGFNSADLANNNSGVNLSDVVLKMDTKQSSLGVKLSDGYFTLKQVDYAEGQEKMSLEGLKLTAASNEEGEVIHFSFGSTLQKLRLPTLPGLGKPFSLDNYTGNWAFRNIDEKSLLSVQQSMQQFTGQGIVNLSEDTAGMAMFALMGTLMQITPDVIARSPEIALTQLNMSTSEGNLNANGVVKIDGSQVKELSEPAIVTAIQAQAKLLMAKQLLKAFFMMDNASEDRAEKSISEAQKEGWLVPEGNTALKSELSMANGKLTVNGKVMFDLKEQGNPEEAEPTEEKATDSK